MLNVPSAFFSHDTFLQVLTVLYHAAFFLVPLVLCILLWELWIAYRRALFFGKQTYILLEIKVPREIFKSPKAMEFFMNGLYQTGGELTFIDRWWKGQTRAWFSLEIVSIDGSIHFFIWTRTGHRAQIEANLYSQFPGIEIFDVPDYTLPVRYDPEVVGLWGTEFALAQPDAYPIKTYVDYGMDKDPKEEFKIDPLTPLIEFLGALGRGHQIWIQILIRAHKAEHKDPATGKMVDKKWVEGAKAEIKKIQDSVKPEKDKEGKIIAGTNRPLTEAEQEKIKALDRSISKPGYDVGIRAIYTAPKDIYVQGTVGGIIGNIVHFNSNNLNGFKPARITGGKYDYPWQDRKKKKTNKEKRLMLDAFKKRSYFYNEHKKPSFVLNTEELATLFHFPGSVSLTPTFERIDAKKAEAPANLPT